MQLPVFGFVTTGGKSSRHLVMVYVFEFCTSKEEIDIGRIVNNVLFVSWLDQCLKPSSEC